jgi:hypothetical protein
MTVTIGAVGPPGASCEGGEPEHTGFDGKALT